MKAKGSSWTAVGLCALALLAAASPAHAVRTTLGTTSGYAGQTVLVSLTTTSLTGFNVRSFQFDVTYNANVATATAVVESSTIVSSAGWGDATFNVTPGHLSVSHAGSTALTGSGTLCVLRFVIQPALVNGGSTTLHFGAFTFNEGSPPDTTVDGSITVTPIPVITVSPNAGEIIRGQTLQFSVSGSVTNPVTWGTTNPTVATISGSGLLTGVAPGSVRVFVVDAASRRDTSDGLVIVRGMGITVGSASLVPGQTFTLPVTVTSLSGLHVRSGQFTISYLAPLFTVTGVGVPSNALLYGYGPVGFSAGPGACTVDFAGTTDLGGSGTLFTLQCQASATVTGGTTVSFLTALFNENLVALPTSGSVSVNALPSITVTPDAATLLAGETRNFTVSGPAVPPITWTTLDTAVAKIDPTGKLTAVAGGVTQVKARDAVGNFDFNSSVTVYDYKLTVSSAIGPPGSTVRVELRSDRNLGAFKIYSVQYTLLGSAYVTQMRVRAGGLIGAWSLANIAARNSGGTSLIVAAAGAQALGNGTLLHAVDVTISPAAPLGTFIPLTLTSLICNEGHPAVQSASGGITVQTTNGVGARQDVFALAAPEPNPCRGGALVRFVVPPGGEGGESAALAIHGIDGRLVRTLVGAVAPAGAQEAFWDGRNDAGDLASPGIYLLRLDWAGRHLTRRLVLLR